jgi:hypothetical protein
MTDTSNLEKISNTLMVEASLEKWLFWAPERMTVLN